MGRWRIWSDPQVKELASKFVCVIEETFFLYPPARITNPPNPASTELFTAYAANAPKGTWRRNTKTYQGLYCMSAKGTFLAGNSGRQTAEQARELLGDGWSNWQVHALKRAWRSQPVPTDPLPIYGGDELAPGALKLQIAYRDLPRGKIRRPGETQLPNPYNLGWLDLSAAEAKGFVATGEKKEKVSQRVFDKLACEKLKDSVRGQMRGWNRSHLKDGALFTERIATSGSEITCRLTGSAELRNGDLTYTPTLHGLITYDSGSKTFTGFRLIAAGQRAGKGGANGRETDLGPAPMGVAFELFGEHKQGH